MVQIGAWWRGFRELVASDVAVHGLAYLGVLLTFAGTLGFVFFAFRNVNVNLRPAAELAIPLVLFGSSWFLWRRGTPLVAASIEFLGGALLPVVAFAAFLDGSPLPPDAHGASEVAVLAVVAGVLAGVYAAEVRRRPASPLRYLAGLMAWTAVGVAGFGIHGHRSAAQMALVAAAAPAAVALTRLRPAHPVARGTAVAAVPGAALAYLLTLLFAGTEGWPGTPLAFAGAATAATLELLRPRLGRGSAAVPFAVWAVLAVTVGGLIPDVGAGWAGVIGVTVFLLFTEREVVAGPDAWVLLVGAVGMVAALILSEFEPWPAVAGWGLAAAWAHVRRIARPRDVPRWALMGSAAALPVGLVAGLLRAGPDEVAWMVMAGALAAGALVLAVGRDRDPFWSAWIPGAAGLVAAGVGFEWLWSHVVEGPVEATPALFAVAAGLAGLAVVVATRQAGARVWSGALIFAEAIGLALAAAGTAPRVQPAVFAAAGLFAVIAASAWPGRWGPDPAGTDPSGATVLAGHLAAAGHVFGLGAVVASHVFGLGAVVASRPGAWRITILALVAVSWAITVVGRELGRAPFVDLLARQLRAHIESRWVAAILPVAALLASTAGLAVEATRGTGLTAGRPGWDGLTLVAAAWSFGGAALVLRRRTPLSETLAMGAVVTALTGLGWTLGDELPVAGQVPWTVAVALAGTVAVHLAAAGAVRRGEDPSGSRWAVLAVAPAWAWSMGLVLALANRAGIPGDRLHLVALVYGAGLLAGGLAADDLAAGRRRPGEWVRRLWLGAPVLAGAVAVPVSLGIATAGPVATFGWWALGTAAAVGVVAWQLRVAAVSSVAYALAVVGGAALWPRTAADRPWLLLLPAVSLCAAAYGFARRPRNERDEGSPWFLRWDLPPLVVAHVVALSALALTLTPGLPGLVPTWVGFGALSLAVAVWRRHVAWAVAGTGMVLVGAGSAGHGWFALALAGTSSAAAVWATRVAGGVRSLLQVVSVVAAGAAWGEAMAWAGWSRPEVVAATALASGAVIAGAGLGVRLRILRPDWATAGAALATGGLLFSGAVLPSPDHLFPWLSDADGLGMAAAGMALAAAPLRQPALRIGSALTALGAGAAALATTDPTVIDWVGYGAIASVGAVVTGLALWRMRRRSPWLPALAALAGAAEAVTLAAALSAIPRRGPLEVALLVGAIEAVAAGLVTRRPRFYLLAPPPLAAAWLVFASGALAGDPQWFTAPIGLTLLAMAELARWDRRSRQAPSTAQELVILEMAGVAFLVGASLVETVARTVTAGLVAVLLGILVCGWGALTRIRRRVYAGAATVVLALFLMVAVPVAHLVPQIRGATLWTLLVGIGVVFIAAALSLERGRARIRASVKRLEELMAAWD